METFPEVIFKGKKVPHPPKIGGREIPLNCVICMINNDGGVGLLQ
jgi:hypothetical protein